MFNHAIVIFVIVLSLFVPRFSLGKTGIAKINERHDAREAIGRSAAGRRTRDRSRRLTMRIDIVTLPRMVAQ